MFSTLPTCLDVLDFANVSHVFAFFWNLTTVFGISKFPNYEIPTVLDRFLTFWKGGQVQKSVTNPR